MDKDKKKNDLDETGSRREFLSKTAKGLIGAGVASAGLGMAVGRAHAITIDPTVSSKLPKDSGTLKYSDNYWNRDALARIMGDLEFGKQKFGWYRGTVIGVKKGEKNRELCGFEGFSFARLKDAGNGVYEKLLREVGFYTDLKTGEVLEEWENPYTDETVKVVHIANDPFNFKIGPFYPKPPSYGGLNKKVDLPDIPMILPWTEVGDNKVMLQSNTHLYYKNALQPDKWPRESSGEMNRVSEMFTYVFDKEDLADPKVTGLMFSGSWNRITPWLPWMLMGEAEGHAYYNCIMGCYDNMDMMSPKVLAYAKKHYPKYFEAPTEWVEPSWSSLEHYANEQTPAPVKKS
ncbi:DUF1838 family protein [Aliiglaciecola sp. 3_MG-2023]|uniref:DUF1838 family protein n=1 Tax=Aliiglaciecola sp. 3_MG-2023 TaxID=3062644 RepID=UPI0026E32226|nr:DUF1838 family protein [Aliiglaciecola sp. 3_MG-2023]MDO6693057.1 DUF1838 family protein [Aliiglaciecola sp. 3_MG-2023]